jgi:transcriptional regulator with XRE-family HTH domain
LGADIKKQRTETGYTVGGVADQIRINESTIRNYEHGNRLPRIDILYGLSQIYKLSVDDIIKNTIK